MGQSDQAGQRAARPMNADTSLKFVLDPQSVVIFGASDNHNKVGGRPLHYLKKFGYRGRVYPINPHRTEVQGYRSYAALDQLPETPELALVIVSDKDVIGTITACAEKGVKCALVISSGFGETGASGLAVQNEIVAIAKRAGMRVIGPNT